MAIDITKIQEELSKFGEVDLVGPVSEHEVAEAEKSLGVQFGPEYKAFLMNFGSGGVSSEEFIGLGGPPHLNVVEVTKRLRGPSTHARFPLHFVPLQGDGYGNFDCLDTSHCHEATGPEVVQWLHDGGDDQDCEVLGASFSEWLAGIFQLIRELDAGLD